MNDCKKYILYMNMHLDDELEESLQAELEAHLEHCPNCQKRFAEYCMISTQLQGGASVPKDLHSSIMAYVHSNTVAAKPKKRFNVSAFGLVAAMLLLVFTGVFTRFNSTFLFQDAAVPTQDQAVGVPNAVSAAPDVTEGGNNKEARSAMPFAVQGSVEATEEPKVNADVYSGDMTENIDIDESLAYYHVFRGQKPLPEFVSDYVFTKDKEYDIYYIFVDNVAGEYEKIEDLLGQHGFISSGDAPNAPEENKSAKQGLVILILQ